MSGDGSSPDAERVARLEEHVAHLMRQTEDLSEVVARQETAIVRLTARVGMLMTREAEREADATGQLPIADRPPPHW